MQKHVKFVDLVKSFPTDMFLKNLASIQPRTSPLKFAHLAEKLEEGSISNLSTKPWTLAPHILEELIPCASPISSISPIPAEKNNPISLKILVFQMFAKFRLNFVIHCKHLQYITAKLF